MNAINKSHKNVCVALAIGAAVSFAMACGGGSSVTAEQACATFAANACAKIQACEPAIGPLFFGDVSACAPFYQAECQNVASAPQSGYTPSVVSACAGAIEAVTCAELNINPAACQPHGGTIQIGGACGVDWQCASGRCSARPDGSCGSCIGQVAKGGACTGSACADGLICALDANGAETCLAPVPLGGTCLSTQVCPANAYCKQTGSSTTQGICSPLPGAGQACDLLSQVCDYWHGVECNPSTLVCQNVGGTAQPGAACGWIAGQFIECIGVCSPSQSGDMSTCMAQSPTLSEGQACVASGPSCASGLQCVAGVCAHPGPTTCGGSEPSPEAGAPDATKGSPPFDIWDGGLADANLADTINVEACATVDVSFDAAPGGPVLFPPACGACCNNAGYKAATINDGRCVCSVYPQGREETACADAVASIGVCGACCNDAGFSGAGLQGPSGDAGGVCTCSAIHDMVTCASTTADPNPSAACDLCCVRHGYANYGYGSRGGAGGICTCQSP